MKSIKESEKSSFWKNSKLECRKGKNREKNGFMIIWGVEIDGLLFEYWYLDKLIVFIDINNRNIEIKLFCIK